jgi:putative ABC transport system permease protein
MTAPRRARVAVVLSGSEHPADVARGDLQIRVHLAALEALTGREDAVDRVIVRLQPDAGAETRERLRDDLRALEVGVDTYTTDELIASTSRTFVVVSRFHRAIAVVTIAASVIFLVTIMALRLTELRREIGALRLIGVSRGTIALMIMLVAGLTVLLGCAAGIGMGALMVWGINAYYRPLFETTLRFALLNTRTVLVAAGLAVLVSLAAGAGVAAQFLRRPALDQVGR